MAHAASHEQNGSKEDGRVNEGAGGRNKVMSRDLPGGGGAESLAACGWHHAMAVDVERRGN
jgi:hypothetical protein